MNLEDYPDREFLMIELAHKLAGDLNTALMTHDTVTFAVPGGTTPGPAFDALSAADLDWSRVQVLLTDERWVPETSDRSNARLIRERLLQDKAAKARFIGYYDGSDLSDAGVAKAADRIAPLLPISVLLLGMGADMHTASLFPGSDQLAAALDDDAPALMAVTAPGAPEPRVTLTAPALKSALAVHVLITGRDKRDALEKAVALDDPMQAPVSVILGAASVHWAE
ncbi:6-phosphogluconolactonase [Meridianimarinicoccus sp. MJW13]|uniref:6-phosphogluconolactonase n=1 Tax=Meridianimarinicoccus sp. MJW13 TaxID=2720031 RepID=UPI00186923E3|nr:6-phosphogluconolactonase [Fluviibacterium sp. MJW13]